MISSCPTHPPRLLVSSIQPVPQNMSPLTIVVTLITPHISLPVHALLASGSAGSFISGSLCRQLKIPTAVNPKTYQIQSITGKSLSRHNVRYLAGPITLRVGLLHEENIQLLVLEEANTDIILGRPWFTVHEPQIVWRTGDILKWGNQCFPDCFPSLPRPSPPAKPILSLNAMSIESPVDQQSVDIPYSHFSDVFCPKKASQLPPHRPRDCAIYLLPGESVPKGKIYPLSLPEQNAMEEYIEEALQQGYIRPSTSPAASSLFFVAKKDRGLRPCIDYWSLTNITVKFRYPLPLVPAALEHLCGATIFTKLDLRNAYIRIREGDEWKTAFVTPTGHYEYLVMPYGLVNAPLRISGLHAHGAPRVPPSLRLGIHR